MTLEQETEIRWVFGIDFEADYGTIAYTFKELLDDIFNDNQQDKICDEMYDDPSRIDDEVPYSIIWWIEDFCRYEEKIDDKLKSCIEQYAVKYFHKQAEL